MLTNKEIASKLQDCSDDEKLYYRDIIFNKYTSLVDNICKSFIENNKLNNSSEEDLKQAGYLGFIECYNSYFTRYPDKFTTYVYSSVEKALATEYGVVDKSVVLPARRYMKYSSSSSSSKSTAQFNRFNICFDSFQVFADQEYMGVDSVPSYHIDDYILLRDLTEGLNNIMATLKDRDREIIKMYLGFYEDEMTFEEIGKKFYISSGRVSQIYNRAIRRLRRPSLCNDLRVYID